MEIFFVLHDNDDVVHDEFQYVFNSQETLEKLKNKISSNFAIPTEKQILLLESGEELSGLGGTTLKSLGLKEGTKVVVKHSLLPHWTSLLGIVRSFDQSNDSRQKKMHFELAKQYMKFLIDSQFLLVYADLNQRYIKILSTLYKHHDRRPEAMQNAVKAFFGKKLMGKNPNFSFADKTEGCRAGIICTIEYQDTIETFYLKTNHDAERSEIPSRTELDIRELFIYRFLERLGIGATIHFPTSAIGSQSLLYIASREISEFKTFDEIEQTETDYIDYVHPAIQILTIFTVLSIGDCHSKNVGVDKNKSPFIVDFCLARLGIRTLERDFLHHVRASNEINKKIDEYHFKDRVKVGVDFLRSIEFEKNLHEAMEHFIEKDKKSFDDDDLHFNLNKTDDFSQYIEVVKENMNKFFTYCN